MRLLKEIPEIEEKLERGDLSLSTLARAQSFFRQEKDQTITREELKILVETDFLNDLEELKNLLAHRYPGGSLKDLLGHTVRETTQRLRPKSPAHKVENATASKAGAKADPLPTSENVSRYIHAKVKRAVWQRDGGTCSFVDPSTKRICGSRHAIQYDHIQPVAMGGTSTADNLCLLCRAHNQLAAVQAFGVSKMAGFVPKMRVRY